MSNLTLAQVRENLMHYVKTAPPEDAERYANWYHVAHDECLSLAHELYTYFPIIVGMTAVLSNTMRWEKNIDSVRKIIMQQSIDGIPTYKKMRYKALALWHTGDLSLVTGPKVVAFYNTILNPEWDETPTVDLWMMRAAGYYCSTKNSPKITDMRVVQQGIRHVTQDTNWTIGGTQAVIWETIRKSRTKRNEPFYHPVTGEVIA